MVIRNVLVKHSSTLISIISASVVYNLLMLTGPLFMLQIYDRVLGSNSKETLVALFILVIGIYFFMFLLDLARKSLLVRLAIQVSSQLGARTFFAQLQKKRSGLAKVNSSGSISDLDTIQSFVSSPSAVTLIDLPWVPFFFGALFLFNPILGWTGIVGALFLVGLALANNILTKEKTELAQQQSHTAKSIASNAMSSFEIVTAQGMAKNFYERISKHQQNSFTLHASGQDINSILSSASKSFRLALQATILAVGAYLAIQGEMSAGGIIVASILLGRGLQPIESLLAGWSQVRVTLRALRSLRNLFNDFTEETEKPGQFSPQKVIRLKSVSVVSEASKSTILKGISLTIGAGEVLGVLGNSGSGKSSLAKVLIGVIRPTIGEVSIGGADLDQYDRSAFSEFVGYLPQNPELFPATVAENIARMSLNPDIKKVISASQKSGVHEMIMSLPQGYQTQIGENGVQISGGQRQRIALARALYGDPELLVFDEPNSALDVEGSNILNETISELKEEGKCILIMTHRPMALSVCDNLVVLQNGAIIARGTRDEVLKKFVKNHSKLNV